jgi:cell division transport system permease protein
MTDISIYLKEDTTPANKNELINKLKSIDGINEIKFISKEEALKFFKEDDDIKIMLEVIGENPLPESIDLVLDKSFRKREKIKDLQTEISKYNIVEDIYSRSKVTEMISFIKSSGSIAFFIFFIITIIIIANTIRLTVYSKSQEIEIRRLVGATELFVRAPFVIEGCLKGLISGIVSILLMFFIRIFVFSSIKMPVGTELIFLSFIDFILILILGIVTGGISSLFALKKATVQPLNHSPR